MRRRLVAVIALVVASTLPSACGSESATAASPTVVSVVGTWNLTSVNGAVLPFTYQASDPKLELLAKQYVISDAGTFTYSYSVRATDDDGTVTISRRSDTGTATLADNAVTFRYDSDGSTGVASVAGNTMTLVAGDYSQVFTKQ